MNAAAHSLMPLVVDPARLKHAARALMRRPGAPGVDGLTWAGYRRHLDTRIDQLSRRLRSHTWQPAPVRTITWPSWGKQLTVSIPTVEDRIVHRSLRTAAEAVLEHGAYLPWMYGWRRRAGRVEAVRAAAAHLAGGAVWVADIDIATATSGATVEATIGWLARWIHDGTYLRLVRRILTTQPTPLAPGSGLTPMLTNLRLAGIDHQLNAAAERLALVRLTDNYAAFCPTRTAAIDAYEQITTALVDHGLAANTTKSKVWQPNPEDLFLAG